MNSKWQIDLFNNLNKAENLQAVLDAALIVIKPWGFDYAGWRSSLPIPMVKRESLVFNTTEDKIIEKAKKGDYDNSPGVRHCSQSMEPVYCRGTTHEPLFFEAPELWEEYYGLGRKACWAQSLIESSSIFSMFWVDSSSQMTLRDMDNVYFKMQWLALSVLSKMNQLKIENNIVLSEKEKEVLRWCGDGKTVDQIGKILNVSCHDVMIYINSAKVKLAASNTVSAVIKAIYLGLLH